jgi:hypothetical protein
MTRARLNDNQLRALSAAKASELLLARRTPLTEADYLALAAEVERQVTQNVAAMDPPDMRTWREVIAELRRRAWRLPHDKAG